MSQRLPKPPHIVGSAGSPSVPLSRAVKGAINYLYPQDFPENSRMAVKIGELRCRDLKAEHLRTALRKLAGSPGSGRR